MAGPGGVSIRSGLICIGYPAHFEALTPGHLSCNHHGKNALVLEASRFSDLYDGPVFSARKTGTDACPEHCLHREDLAR